MPSPKSDVRELGSGPLVPGAGFSDDQLKLVAVLSGCVTALLVLFPRFATVITSCIFLAVVLIDPLVRSWRGLPQVEWISFKAVQPYFWPFVLFWAWAGTSLLWTANPGDAAGKVLILGGLIVMCLGTGEGLRAADSRLIRAIVAGFLTGMILIMPYVFYESLSGRGISRFLIKHLPFLQNADHKHVQVLKNGTVFVSEANLNRATAVFCLLCWPAALGALSLGQSRRRTAVLLALFVAGVAILIWSPHQSSQLALVASAATFAAASYFRGATTRVLAGLWIAVLALVVPASVLAFDQGLHQKPWLFNTAKARVIIWNFTAKRVLERPLVGVGVDAAPLQDEARTAEKLMPKGLAAANEKRAHPHNVYLQIWYELGLVGAVLLGWFGLTLTTATRNFPARIQPFVLADLTLIATIVVSSYGLWQTWLQVAIAFSYLMIIATARALETTDASDQPA